MYLDYSSSHNVSFYLLLFIIIQKYNQKDNVKVLERREKLLLLPTPMTFMIPIQSPTLGQNWSPFNWNWNKSLLKIPNNSFLPILHPKHMSARKKRFQWLPPLFSTCFQIEIGKSAQDLHHSSPQWWNLPRISHHTWLLWTQNSTESGNHLPTLHWLEPCHPKQESNSSSIKVPLVSTCDPEPTYVRLFWINE